MLSKANSKKTRKKRDKGVKNRGTLHWEGWETQKPPPVASTFGRQAGKPPSKTKNVRQSGEPVAPAP